MSHIPYISNPVLSAHQAVFPVVSQRLAQEGTLETLIVQVTEGC